MLLVTSRYSSSFLMRVDGCKLLVMRRSENIANTCFVPVEIIIQGRGRGRNMAGTYMI